jgi:hypothetical protein
MAASLSCHWMRLGATDRLVDDLIESKAELINALLRPSQERQRRQAFPALVRQWLEDW